MPSTACWSWDARVTSASPDPDVVGIVAPTPLIRAPRQLGEQPMSSSRLEHEPEYRIDDVAAFIDKSDRQLRYELAATGRAPGLLSLPAQPVPHRALPGLQLRPLREPASVRGCRSTRWRPSTTSLPVWSTGARRFLPVRRGRQAVSVPATPGEGPRRWGSADPPALCSRRRSRR